MLRAVFWGTPWGTLCCIALAVHSLVCQPLSVTHNSHQEETLASRFFLF